MTEERNFCPRCGKRRGGDVNYIHTCTPPQPEREWVETNNFACKILRQVHDMLALASVPNIKTVVGLTDKEIETIKDTTICLANESWLRSLARNLEAKLKEKNND